MCLWWNSTVEISPIFNEVLYMSVWKFNVSNISDRFCWVFINNGDIPKLLMFWRNNAEFTFNKLSYKSSNFLHVHVCLTTILHYLESLFDSPESHLQVEKLYYYFVFVPIYSPWSFPPLFGLQKKFEGNFIRVEVNRKKTLSCDDYDTVNLSCILNIWLNKLNINTFFQIFMIIKN